MTSWTDAGFALDPEGDASRRAAMQHAILQDVRAVEGLTAEAVTGSALEQVERAVALVTREPEVVEGELLDPVDPHELLVETFPAGPRLAIPFAHLSCRCGEWEAVVTGTGSSRWAIEEHREHAALVADS